MDEKGVFVWSRGRDGALCDVVVESGTACNMQGYLQHNLGMVPGKRYLLTAKEAPLPCPHFEPKPEGEMVRIVLLGYGRGADGSCNLFEAGGPCTRSETGSRRHPDSARTMLGTYQVPPLTELRHLNLPDMLKRIRDAGGVWESGEPLPEKAEETWPHLILPNPGDGHAYACPICCMTWAVTNPKHCTCGTHLKGTAPWPTIPPNKEC